MKAVRYPLALAGLLVTSLLSLTGAGRFEQKLPTDRQIVHALNRLTFGPRPGDVEAVRRLTLEKWIEQQLQPERIAENPALESKLKPLATLQLAMWQILDQYPATPAGLIVRPPSANVMSLLTPQQIAKLMNGSLEDRRAFLASLEPDKRRMVLSAIPTQVLEFLPDDLRKEAEMARQAEQDALQKERRRLMPPLNQLLAPEQMRIINRGSREEKIALLSSFDAETRQRVMRSIPPQSVAEIPQLRRESMSQRQPQELVH